MKIGIDASRYAAESATGVEWYSYHIINGLLSEALKHEYTDVVLYSPREIEIPKEFEHPGRIVKRILPIARLWTLVKLSLEMRRNPPDVLFVPSHVLPLIRPKFSVITIHDTAFKYLRSSYSAFQYWYLNWSTKYAVKHASKIIVPSEATRRDLVQLFKCPLYKIEVIHHGFKVPKHVGGDAPNDVSSGVSENLKIFGFGEGKFPYVLFVGRLESKKNLVNLVEAFKNFNETMPEYKLILAGKRGVGFDEIFDKVRKLRLEEKVIMPGYVSEDEKDYLYRNCSIFAFPSLYEGFGFPILEAFSYKKPVLTSHVSCMPDIAGSAALYCDPFDPTDMARNLEKLAKDKEFSEDLIKKGEERLKLFSWQISVKKTFDVLTK